MIHTTPETNRIPQTEKKVRSAYVRITIHIYIIYFEVYVKRVAAETENEETASEYE